MSANVCLEGLEIRNPNLEPEINNESLKPENPKTPSWAEFRFFLRAIRVRFLRAGGPEMAEGMLATECAEG